MPMTLQQPPRRPGARWLRAASAAAVIAAALVGCALPEAPPAPPAAVQEAQDAQGVPGAQEGAAPAEAPTATVEPTPVPLLSPQAQAAAEPALRLKPERSPFDSAGPPALRLPEPVEPPELLASGTASWYADSLHGRRTANGERYDRDEFTAAHRSLPFGTRLCVRSLVNGNVVTVRVNDRGPFAPGRIIDLSRAAAEELGMMGLGIKPVELWRLADADDTCPDSLDQPIEGAGLGLDAEAAARALRERPAARAVKAGKAGKANKARKPAPSRRRR